jgi:multisubunit Na+/H+ antiporter MnhE subunit
MGMSFLVRSAAFFALWLLLVDDVTSPQLWTGAVVAVLAAGLAVAIDRLRAERPRLKLRMLARIYRPLLLLVTDSARVSWALVRMLSGRGTGLGRLYTVPYRAIGNNSEEAARRALTEWAASLAPNRYVIGCDRDTGVLLVHELLPARGPSDPLELG